MYECGPSPTCELETQLFNGPILSTFMWGSQRLGHPGFSLGRSLGEEGSGGWSAGAAVHQDQPVAWQRDGHALPQLQRRAALPAQARVSHSSRPRRPLCDIDVGLSSD